MKRPALKSLLAVACYNVGACSFGTHRAAHNSDVESSKSELDQVVVRLTPQSRKIMKDHLVKRKLGNFDVQDVIINNYADKQAQQVYSNLYGTRIAFRLKGYVRSKANNNKRKGAGGVSVLTVRFVSSLFLYYPLSDT